MGKSKLSRNASYPMLLLPLHPWQMAEKGYSMDNTTCAGELSSMALSFFNALMLLTTP